MMKNKALPCILLYLLAASSRANARKHDSSPLADSLMQLLVADIFTGIS